MMDRTEAFEALFSAMAQADGVGAFSDDAEATLAALEAAGWQLVPSGVAARGWQSVKAQEDAIAFARNGRSLWLGWARQDKSAGEGRAQVTNDVIRAKRYHIDLMHLLKAKP